MKMLGKIFALAMMASTAWAQGTITVPVPAGATSVTITVLPPVVTQGAPSVTFVTPAPISTPSPSPQTGAMVYNNGSMSWPGDYSYPGGGVTVDYKNTSCAEGGTLGLKISHTAAWAGWLPYAPNWKFDLTPYGKAGYLVLDLKPSVASQSWAIYAVKVGDLPISGPNRFIESYGAIPTIGKWATYKVPLADFMTDNGTQLMAMYKFGLQDKTNLATNSWCVNNVHFSAV